jgi:hypothetical protein
MRFGEPIGTNFIANLLYLTLSKGIIAGVRILIQIFAFIFRWTERYTFIMFCTTGFSGQSRVPVWLICSKLEMSAAVRFTITIS